MSDQDEQASERSIFKHIEQLVDEEHRLYNQKERSDTDRARLAKIQVELDQCWDLLRQRQALREFGRDPKEAHVRSPDVVEHYKG